MIFYWVALVETRHPADGKKRLKVEVGISHSYNPAEAFALNIVEITTGKVT